MNQKKKTDLSFEELTFGYMKPLFKLAYAKVGNSDDAEDIVQETYLKAFRAIDSLRNHAEAKTWLTRILINTANDHLRKSSRTVAIIENGEDVIDIADPSEQGAEHRLCQNEIDPDLLCALHSLPEAFLTPLVLREIYEASYEEIAKVLDLPKGTVMSRLFRARTLLRKQLLKNRNKDASISAEQQNQQRNPEGGNK